MRSRKLSHQADLNPVSLQQIIAAIAQQISRLLQLPSHGFGTEFLWKRQGHNRWRCMLMGSDDIESKAREPIAQVHGKLYHAAKPLVHINALDRRLQRENQV